jgi:hypothetical protein
MRDYKYEFQTNTVFQEEFFSNLRSLRDDYAAKGDNTNCVKINTIGIRSMDYLEKLKKF